MYVVGFGLSLIGGGKVDMEKGLILQERDIALLEFLSDYKTITLDNAKYIYGTKTYQEKRICALVKANYIARLKHREIALGRKGKEFLIGIGKEIREHCRTPNNKERLKVISDLAAFTTFYGNMFFLPSWSLKDKDSPTTHSRRYLGMQSFDENFYNIYAIYGEKNDKYITSIYYDIKKEREIENTIIFTNDIEKILYHKHTFSFGASHLYLIPYNDFSKEIMVNYDKIRRCMFTHLSKKHEVKYTDFWYMDFLVDNKHYLKIMLFLDLNQIYGIYYFLDINSSYKDKVYFICFEENAKYLKEIIPGCNVLVITKEEVEKYIAGST